MGGFHGRMRWLLGINLVESLLLLLCVVTGFNFIVLGARPAQTQLSSQVDFAVQVTWNASLLIFGLVALISGLHPDLVTRKLLRLFSHGGLAVALFGYTSALIVTLGWTKSSLAIPSLAVFCLMFIGTSLQTALTLERRKRP